MKITIIAVGTRGDVQPAIALGKGLKQQGHDVRLIATRDFCDWIEKHGLEAFGTSVNMQELMASEGGVKWVEKGHNPLLQMRLMKKLLATYGWQLTWDTWQGCQGSEAIISSFTSDVYTTAMAEKLNVSQISMVLQPPMMPTRLGAASLSAPLPHRTSWLNYGFGKIVMEPAGWQLAGDLTKRLRRELRLPRQSGRENKQVRRKLLTLLGYSGHVVPHAPDWPSNVHTTGYWFLHEESAWQPSIALQDFLANGPPPIYIGFGSMTGGNVERMSRLINEGVRLSGQRAIVGAGWAGLGHGGASEQIFQIGSVPHEWLFPQLAGVVHHGGAGTTGAGLRAGVPTMIVPHFADQPFWGQRIAALGVGPKPVFRHKLTAELLAQGIQAMVQEQEMRETVATLSQQIRAEDGIAHAVRLIEEHLGL